MLEPDFSEMLSILSARHVEYLVVGGYALAAHGHPRATGDLDIWVSRSPDNARQVMAALVEFGAPLFDLTTDDLMMPGVVFQIGVAPVRIDILTELTDVDFADAWLHRVGTQIGQDSVQVIGREHLIKNKLAVGRPQDIADVAALRSAR